MPLRFVGGAVRDRSGWLANAAYIGAQIRTVPCMVDIPNPHGPPTPGFANHILAAALGRALGAGGAPALDTLNVCRGLLRPPLRPSAA